MTIVDGIVAWTPNNATCDLNQSMCNGDYPPAKCARLTGLSVLAPLVADFTATTPCLGAPTEFSDTTQGGQEPYSYEWSFGDGTTSTDAAPTHTYASAGSHVVTLTVTDSQTPPVVDTQTYSVTVNPNPEASITPSSAVLTCDNPSVTLTASGAATGGSYLWSTGATTAAITVSSPGNYTVTVKNAFGCSDTASATVTEHKPVDIRVQKSANPTSVPETGGDVAFTYSVFNDGCTSAKITSLDDDQFGTLAGDEDCKVGTWLAGGADCTFNATFAVPAGDALDTHVDVFTATAEDSQGLTDTATASASVGYTDVQPTVSLAKVANPSNMLEPGGAFAYTLTITNTSYEEVWITDLEDTYPLSDECLALVEDNTSLAPDASISCDYTVTHTDAGTYSNTATVTVMDDEENPASDTASAQVTVADVPPTITVAKTANPSVVPETGGEVTYSVTVTNTSAEPVTLGSLIDDRFGHLSGQGTCTTGGDIAVDMSYTCSFTKTLSSPSLTPHTNVVTATAYDDEENPATETAEADRLV